MVDELQSIRCQFMNEAQLYLAYMPFIKNGGLFIRTQTSYELGTELQLSVLLLNEPEPYLVGGKVVWFTPKGAVGNKPVGVGIQFIGENSRTLSNKIETYLAGHAKSTHPTDTM